MEKSHAETPSRGSIRWAILRQAIKVPPPPSISGAEAELADEDGEISRRDAISRFYSVGNSSPGNQSPASSFHLRCRSGTRRRRWRNLTPRRHLEVLFGGQFFARQSKSRLLLPSPKFLFRRTQRSVSIYHSIGTCAKDISRKTPGGFKLISCCPLNGQMVGELQAVERACQIGRNELFICYALPVEGDSELIMIQRLDDCINLDDFEISNRHDIDTTGLVCCWPSEDALAYFCIENGKMFRSKRVLELGSGYGLAGLAIAANTDAFEVVISDGNPQVIDYVQRNIDINARTFGDTEVKSMILHWSQEHSSEMLNRFDIIIASDCTFFKEFHESLAQTVKSLLKNSEASEAIFLSPRRGDSLTKFLVKIKDAGLDYELVENYNDRIWSLHQKLRSEGDSSWPNYDEDHCYPLLLRAAFPKTRDHC